MKNQSTYWFQVEGYACVKQRSLRKKHIKGMKVMNNFTDTVKVLTGHVISKDGTKK